MQKKFKSYPKLIQINDSHHTAFVKEIFKTIPKRYDFLNHFLSLWQDVLWRRFTVKQARLAGKKRLLDVATGTGDLALLVVRKNPGLQVVGLDFSSEMLALCNQKIHAQSLSDKVQILQGDALALPFPDNSFAALTIGFGIRNIPDKPRALKEMQRVVMPGGQVMILEMGLPAPRIFRFFYNLYLKHLIPFIARLFSPNPEAYYYLADSIQAFPKPAEFLKLMRLAGFQDLKKHALSFGITYLFIGEKEAS